LEWDPPAGFVFPHTLFLMLVSPTQYGRGGVAGEVVGGVEGAEDSVGSGWHPIVTHGGNTTNQFLRR